jgi:methylmalonyl-CoA mutase
MTTTPAHSGRKQLLTEFAPVSYDDWRHLVETELKGAAFDKRMFTSTYEGITLKPLYRREDTTGLPPVDSFPGFAPFVRGARVSGYVTERWLVAQEILCSDPAEFSQTAREFLSRGLSALNIVLDPATAAVREPASAKPLEAGQCGLTIATLADLEKSLEGVDLARTPLFVRAGEAGLPFAVLLMALSRKRKVGLSQLRGCIEMDPLGLLVRQAALSQSLNGVYDQMALLTRWAADHAPNLRTVCVDSLPWHEAGGHAVQELAYSLATGIDYLRELHRRGVGVDAAAPRMHFAFVVGTNFFMEIGKLRAARLLWSRAVAALGGNERSQKLSLHVRTSRWNKSIYDPHNNLLRATVEAFAGVLGGCDSMEVGAFDEVMRRPDDFSLRLARNTQLILQKECNLTRVIDPAGGSWFVESVTSELAGHAWKLFQEIESQGGMAAALLAGGPQAAVAAMAREKVNAVNRRRDSIIGVNQYADPGAVPPGAAPVATAAVRAQRALPADSADKVMLEKLAKIPQLKDAAQLEASVEAAALGATLAQITRALRSGDASVTAITPVCLTRAAVKFEALRAASDRYLARHKARPAVFLCNLGSLREHKARADFSRGFFAAGGYDVISPAGFEDVAKAARAFAESKAQIAVICSTDEKYPALVPPLVAGIREQSPKAIIVLAGFPQDQIEAHKKSGVNEFIHLRADAVELLGKIHQELGIL